MTYCVVGLGNPGEEYVHTRHNTGRLVLEKALALLGEQLYWKKDSTIQADVASIQFYDTKIDIVYPLSYMNLSGGAVAKKVKQLQSSNSQDFDLNKLIVIHDELDLPIGSFKISFDRGPGGHNGVSSIIEALGTKAFVRIRIGIAPVITDDNENSAQVVIARKPTNAESFVLGILKSGELSALDDVAKNVSYALKLLFAGDLTTAMNNSN